MDARSAQEGGTGSGEAASAKTGDQTTTPDPAGQPDEAVAKLTPEQRRRVLAEADPDEYAQANDRFNGYIGKRLQVERAKDAEAARTQAALDLRARALGGDDAAAREYARTTADADLEQTHRAAWDEARAHFTALDANPVTRPIVNQLAGRDYGQLAGGNGALAALLYKADLAQSVIDHLPTLEAEIRARLEKELRPALEREIRARLADDGPAPDAGTGGAAGAAHRFTVAEIQAMDPATFARNEDEIMRQWARNPHVRARGAA